MKTSDFVLSLIATIMENPSNVADEQKNANDEYNPLARLDISLLKSSIMAIGKLAKKMPPQCLRN